MRAVFVSASLFFVVVAVLCAVRTVSAVPEPAQVARWLAATVGCALIAVFWEVVRRRYVATGSLQSDGVVVAVGGAGIAVLVLMMVVFRLTA